MLCILHNYNLLFELDSSISGYHSLGWLKLHSLIISMWIRLSHRRPPTFRKPLGFLMPSVPSPFLPWMLLVLRVCVHQLTCLFNLSFGLSCTAIKYSSSQLLLLLRSAFHPHLVGPLQTSDKCSTYLILSLRNTACIYHPPARTLFSTLERHSVFQNLLPWA